MRAIEQWVRSRIAVKLTGAMLLVLTGVFALSGYNSIVKERQYALDQIDEFGNSVAQVAANSCVEPLLLRDYPVLETTTELLVGKNGIQFAQVIRADGQVVAHSPDGMNASVIDPEQSRIYTWPIQVYAGASDEIGQFSMAVSTVRADALTKERVSSLIRDLSVAFVVITLCMVIMLKWIVADPLVELGRQAKIVGSGDLEPEIGLATNDELGHLGDALNDMRIDLKGTYREIHDKNEELEMHRLHLQELVDEAVAEVSTLSGLLPICSNCKNIRNDKGYWERIENFIGQRSDTQFSHGICPSCSDKLYPGLSE